MKVKHLIETMQINRSELENGTLKNHVSVQPKKARVAVLISGTGEMWLPLYYRAVEMLFLFSHPHPPPKKKPPSDCENTLSTGARYH